MALAIWLQRWQKFALVFGSAYFGLVVLLCFPFFQRHMLYLNAVKLPLFADFNSPESYGLSPNKTLNLYIQTPDNHSIGAWFVLPDAYYQSLPTIPQDVSEHITPSLTTRPTILFLHGNAATRAFHVRVSIYKALTSRLNANLLAIDYRGFGDSSGIPSEDGVVKDARAAFDWLVDHGAKSADILVMGHSLGTGVGGQLAGQLGNEGINLRGLVLMSPFSSIKELLANYQMFGLIPLMKPLDMIPKAAGLIKMALIHHFDTLSAVPKISTNVLIAHAENDYDIPASHSDVLFDAFMAPHVPDYTAPELGKIPSVDEWQQFMDAVHMRGKARDDLVKSTLVPRFGRVDEFTQDDRTVTLVKTLQGSHDYLPLQDGLQDEIRRRFGF